ncbi:MAG: hypothetical protein CME33_14040 [Gimesia sp.]|nr:hypothetical protein [Gimesia sp.]|tara:strand:+ start:422 stop:703 length:282 start_codon:yes stop_codon:yes gene_type:complete
MNFISLILWGSGLGFAVIFIPVSIILSGFENASYLVVLTNFLSAVLTGITAVLIAINILPLKFSIKTIAIGLIALPTGSFIYAIIFSDLQWRI